ncbi:MAG: AGE family epimerase/isomerase [Stappiaceae bacterium]
MTDYASLIRDEAVWLRAWLFDDALPLWLAEGIDERNGGFVERLDCTGNPLSEARRARVQPRQIYSFVEAGRMGWTGNWQKAATDGLENYIRRNCEESGAVVALVSPDGEVLDASFDLYNQAFTLFGYAHVANANIHGSATAETRADHLLAYLKRNYAHPSGGFEEGNPPVSPLRSNPHMHLFEASLAWEQIEKGDQWSRLADEIAKLCLGKFIDRETGALREFFDENWGPMPGEKGRELEPGHIFEWSWLLMRWGLSRRHRDAIDTAKRLFEIGLEFGVDETRGVVVMGLYDDFSVRDPVARLWPQTEWIKAAIIMAENAEPSDRLAYEAQIHKGILALKTFLDMPVAGLWRDKQLADGRFVEEPVPASTFYHIVCALSELFRYQSDVSSR